MNELITACLESHDISHLMEVPVFLLNEIEKTYLDFIFGYRRRHSAVPSLSRFQKAFPLFIPITNDEHEPLSDIREQFTEARSSDTIAEKIRNVAASLTTGDMTSEEAVADLGALINQVLVSGTTLATLTTFDREHYFRIGEGLKVFMSMIDKTTRGIFPGEVMLIAARLGVGKSTALFFMVAEWLKQGKKILFISKEMPPADVFARIDSIIGGFNPLLLRDEGAKETMMGELDNVKSVELATGGEIIIPRGMMYSAAHIEALAKNLEVDVVVIDGVYLLSPSGAMNKGSAGWESIARVSREVKAAAMNLMLPFVTTTQLKRIGGKEEIDAEDLAYSDALGQDADFVLALKGMPKEDERDLPRMEATLVKNRYGPNAQTLVETNFSTMTRKEILAAPTE